MSRSDGKIKKLFSYIVNQEYVFSVISRISGVFISIIYSIIFNRYLGAELRGEASVIANYISIISAVICIGMYQAYPFYKKKDGDVFYPFLNTMFSFYLLIFIGFAVAAVFLPFSLNLKVALFLIPVQACLRQLNYVLIIERPKIRNISINVIHVLDILVVALLWIFTEVSYTFLVTIFVIENIISFTISFANLKLVFSKLRFTLRLLPEYARFGIMPMITIFLMTVNYKVDILMLERYEPVTMAQIGIYSIGVALAEKVWLIPDAVKDILLSRLCKEKGRGEEEVAKIIRINLVVTVATVLFTALVSKPFVNIVYGEEYMGADVITVIMLAGVIGMIFYKMVYSYNVSLGKRAVNLTFLGVAAAVNVIGNLIFIPSFGIYGAALTSVISYTLCGICFLVYFKCVSGVPLRRMLFIQKEDIALIKELLGKLKKKKVEAPSDDV